MAPLSLRRLKAIIRSWMRQPGWHLRVLVYSLERARQNLVEGLEHAVRSLRVGAQLVPIAGGSGEDDDDEEEEDESEDDDESEDEEDEEDDESDESEDDDEEDDEEEEEPEHKKPGFLKRVARRNERRYKREKKRGDRLEAENKRLKKGGKGDDEEEVADAKEEELQQKADELEEERRSFRLEQAVEVVAKKGLKLGEGKKAKTVHFDDRNDALVYVERAIAKGELDKDDVYDEDGRVNKDAIAEFLTELAEEKPKLLAGDEEKPKPKGKSNAGKGAAAGGQSADPAKHFASIRRNK